METGRIPRSPARGPMIARAGARGKGGAPNNPAPAPPPSSIEAGSDGSVIMAPSSLVRSRRPRDHTPRPGRNSMPSTRVLSVGQCSYDQGAITRTLEHAFDVRVKGANAKD